MVSQLPVIKKKIWKLPESDKPSAEMIAAAGGHEILAQLMMQRGIVEPEQAAAFLDPAKYQPSSPMEFAEMPKAVARIKQAIASQEKVTVYGDYDVDGVTATSVLLTVLKKLGANVTFYIPNRATEGYGLNLKAVSILASKQRTKLIITCDCGISNFAEINLAKSLGVETIIVDHHSMPEILPPAVATLHPKQLPETHKLFHLPGVGVAYKLAEALYEDAGMPEEVPKLHDFVTLGMIADMVPLVQENRYLVQIGLPTLVNSPRAGIRALLDNTVKMDGTDIVGFGLAPRINAVGRLSDAGLAVNLMTVEDEVQAQELANQLEMDNSRRQELCEQIFFEADLKAKHALANGQDNALALYSKGWHHGVVGIVASRLVEKYHCPVFVAELDEEEGKIKGSARGVSGIDLYQILKANEHLMVKWGGHQMAAGFSADAANADLLCRALVDTCNRALTGHSRLPVLDINLPIEPDLVDLTLVKLLRKLGPFGMWNKKPVLSMQSLKVLSTRVLGKEGKHHRLMLRSPDGVNQFECVYWRSAGNVPADGEEIDLAFTAEVNVFNNSERLQLVLCDFKRSGEPDPPPEEDVDFSPPASIVSENTVSHGAASGSATPFSASANSPRSSTVHSTVELPKPKNLHSGETAVVHLETRYDGSTASTSVAEISFEALADDVDGLISGGSDLLDEPAYGSAADAGSVRSAGSAGTAGSAASVASAGSVGSAGSAASVGSVSASRGATQSVSSSRDLPAVQQKESVARSLSDAKSAPQVVFKDLRVHASPDSLLEAASRKLGAELTIFAEACKISGMEPCDRSSVLPKPHLFIWQFPPSMQVFRAIVAKSQASQIYLCGAAAVEDYDASSFLKRLFAMVRYAVNQRDGQAQADKLCAGLATSKMALALGLTILKKMEVIDWYAEESVIYMEMLGAPADAFEDLPEFRQLSNTLKEITEFRNWCAEAPLNEIQSELVPNAVSLGSEKAGASQESVSQGPGTTLRANYNDKASYQSD